MADNNAMVDEFYGAAMSAGAGDNISPRARVEYLRSMVKRAIKSGDE
jgi:hypothetical protein